MTTLGRVYSVTGPAADATPVDTPEPELPRLRRELAAAQFQASWWKILATKAIVALKQNGVISDGDWINEYQLAMSGGMSTPPGGETAAQPQGCDGISEGGHRRAAGGYCRAEQDGYSTEGATGASRNGPGKAE